MSSRRAHRVAVGDSRMPGAISMLRACAHYFVDTVGSQLPLPLLALAIARFADGNWKSGALLASIGTISVFIELVVVNRVRLRNPFYRLRDCTTDTLIGLQEIRRFKAEAESLYHALFQELSEYEQAIVGDRRGLQELDLLMNATDRRQYRERLRAKERELCDLISDFRGFFLRFPTNDMLQLRCELGDFDVELEGSGFFDGVSMGFNTSFNFCRSTCRSFSRNRSSSSRVCSLTIPRL